MGEEEKKKRHCVKVNFFVSQKVEKVIYKK